MKKTQFILFTLAALFLSACQTNPIMTAEQIDEYNRALLAQGDLHLTDMLSLEDSLNASGLPLQFGLTVRPTDVRTIPSLEIISDIKEGPRNMDEHQETQLTLGEGVAILQESDDSLWYRVVAEDYTGWVEKRNIALCSFCQMKQYLTHEPFAVTITLSQETLHGEVMRINMGTRLPLVGDSVLVPVRQQDSDTLQLLSVALQNEVSTGYLPYTWDNIKMLAFRQEGSEYGWGNREGFNDCTGFIKSVYRCVGIKLPRNSSDMRRIQRGNTPFDHQLASLRQCPAGAILLTRSHAMLLLDDKEPHIIHCFGGRYHVDTQEWEWVSATAKTDVEQFYYAENDSLLGRICNIVVIQ